ncbi:hypothetical protein FB45DRAFT_1060405 [Roridomyces roridus]|uniref:F-box domain-containing protein n=1 Tax=Roridomyces roridus TaxID=1738132 RepID=A0AAD7BN37_9AGAR|nr:hypothetical protein FB45DRAFT_1060405 [Roridomyces roridus]
MRDAQELYKRIEELSETIERQKDVLRSLERQRSDAQGELNAILDPMARLPLEISSDILLESLLSTRSMKSSTVLLGVCRRWSEIALATPSLWTHICNNGLPNRFRGLVEMWLPRSQDYPLVLSLHGMDLAPFTDLIHGMGDHARRIQNLQLVQPGMGFHKSLECAPETPLIPLPWLQSLSVEGPAKEMEFSVNSWYYVLRSLPNLVSGGFKGSILGGNQSCEIPSSLQHLYLGEPTEWDRASGALRQLTLPSLRTLHISISYEPQRCVSHLREFLIRSSPPLRSLYLGLPLGRMSTPALFRILSEADILPELAYLGVRAWPWIVEDGADPILEVLRDRRPTLRSFHLAIDQRWPDYEALEHQFIESFRTLADGGIIVR